MIKRLKTINKGSIFLNLYLLFISTMGVFNNNGKTVDDKLGKFKTKINVHDYLPYRCLTLLKVHFKQKVYKCSTLGYNLNYILPENPIYPFIS